MAENTLPQERCDFYVYALLREDGNPFYVGKGKGGRCKEHLRPSSLKKKSNPHKTNIIQKILASGGKVGITKLHENITEGQAFILEQKAIRDIGRLPNGPLCNISDGGFGAVGVRHTAERKAALSIRMKALMASDEIRSDLSNRANAMWALPAHKSLISEAQRAVQSTPAARANKAIKTAASWLDPDTRQRRLSGLAISLTTPEHRALKRALKTTPDAIAAQSARAKAQWADPDTRARLIAAQNAGRAAKRDTLT